MVYVMISAAISLLLAVGNFIILTKGKISEFPFVFLTSLATYVVAFLFLLFLLLFRTITPEELRRTHPFPDKPQRQS